MLYGRSHQRHVDQVLLVGSDAGAKVQHHRIPHEVGQIAAIAGRSIPAMVRRLILAIAHHPPVLPADVRP